MPAFLTMMTIPLTFSIANGLAFGFTVYAILKFSRQIQRGELVRLRADRIFHAPICLARGLGVTEDFLGTRTRRGAPAHSGKIVRVRSSSCLGCHSRKRPPTSDTAPSTATTMANASKGRNQSTPRRVTTVRSVQAISLEIFSDPRRKPDPGSAQEVREKQAQQPEHCAQ